MANEIDVWMPFYIADYLADTMHLDTIQHGAYLLLLMHYWRNGSLPNVDRKLAAIAKLSIADWLDMRGDIAEFFTVTDSNWIQKRLEKERKNSISLKDERTKKAKAAASARWNAPSIAIGNATAMLEECPSSSSSSSSSKPSSPAPSTPPKSTKPSAVKDGKKPPMTGPTWESYSNAYFHRYGAEPTRNATVNGQLASFIKRIGAEDAPHVAAFYLANNSQWYVTKGHSVAQMLADAEKLHTEWKTGRQITSTRARQTDRTQSNADSWAQVRIKE